MTKNCRLVDNEHKRCISCIECLYKEDKARRPWIYEKSLNKTFFKIDVEEKVKNPQRTLNDLF